MNFESELGQSLFFVTAKGTERRVQQRNLPLVNVNTFL